MLLNHFKKMMDNYVKLYIPQKNENFQYTSSEYIKSLINSILTVYAIYLSVKCNNGFNVGHFLLAIIFSPFYIIYHIFATKLCNTI